MLDRGREPSGRRRWAGWAALAIACASTGAAGCVGPKAVQMSRIRYNEAYRDTNDQQLLLNIVRLRYADSPVFIDLPTITSQFELAGQGTYNGGYGMQFPGQTSLGFGALSARDTPTLSFHPREGREIARALLTPLTAELLSVINTGASIEPLLLLVLNDFNDVPNAPNSTLLLPRVPDDNARFRDGARLLASLIERDAVELLIGTTEEEDESSDPIPADAVGGEDVVDAARQGYAFRTRPDGRMTLAKRERGLVMKVRPAFVDSPELEALAHTFRFTPGRRIYRFKSELSADATTRDPVALPDDTIYINLRSVLQILTYLSKGVCVPPEHLSTGIAPATRGPDGHPFDWARVTAGVFAVQSSKHRPLHAEVAVQYRGYWFFIPRDDVVSRATLAILEILFALEESGESTAGPLLTLPVSG